MYTKVHMVVPSLMMNWLRFFDVANKELFTQSLKFTVVELNEKYLSILLFEQNLHLQIKCGQRSCSNSLDEGLVQKI